MGKRIYDYNAYARAAGWQPAPKPAPRPEPTAADIQRESRQIYYGQLIHDGMDEEAAYQATVEHFAINDHRAIGALRQEE